mgnify:CR=1 FL=1
MSSWLTLLAQEPEAADIFVAYNIGDGRVPRASYAEFDALTRETGTNTQLSPFDPRVREIARVRGRRVVELEYENDQALDSGTWYKFIRDGHWRDYDYTLCVGEGTLFAHPYLLRALVAFADARGAHFIASGHEKRRLPRALVERLIARGNTPTPLDALHERMVARAFEIFGRDPAFAAVYDQWGSGFAPETEHHVPIVSGDWPAMRKLRAHWQRRFGPTSEHLPPSWAGRLLQRLPDTLDRWASAAALGADARVPPVFSAHAYPAGRFAPASIPAVESAAHFGVTFHRVVEPEWFGCATNHLFSRAFLERFHEKIVAFDLLDAIDLPFAGTPLEVIWGLLPAWLGVDKWFTNGFHRVRKNFVTYQREDTASVMASYINRYHRGRVVVGWRGDFLKLQAWRPSLGDLAAQLPEAYF